MPRPENRTGVWIIGARGGVATTVICGALALRKALTPPLGMITESELFHGIELPDAREFVFGGHDIRGTSLRESASQICHETGTIGSDLLEAIGTDLDEIEPELRPGILFRCGEAIEGLEGVDRGLIATDAAVAVSRVSEDLERFRRCHDLSTVVVVNLSSTEPALPDHPGHVSADGIARLIEEGPQEALIASTLYAAAAARLGHPYLNFTPSMGALLPGVVELFEQKGAPFMGSDGKTGETLVKSALAPMFKYRNLRILSWQGYNLLGDRDGEVLSHEENKRTKVRSKDHLLHDYLGYPLHTQVEIDYVPSLNDFKTAWDFIHFEGFLGVKMSLQFTWQGCDAILAAPLILDMARLLALARMRGERGALTHLAVFFKSPHGVEEHDLHRQFHSLLEYVGKLRREA